VTFFKFKRYFTIIIANGRQFLVLEPNVTRKDIRCAPKYSTDESKSHRRSLSNYHEYGDAGPGSE
jgi:hypothetical protein